MGDGIETNGPALWGDVFPAPAGDGHKYDRGHAVIFAGGITGTGAARLAARAALRVGAGLVTIAAPGSAVIAHAGRLPDALMVRKADGPDGVSEILEDARINAACLGPAYGLGEETVKAVQALLRTDRNFVLDADAISSFAGDAETLAKLLEYSKANTILTPHAGEFSRLFGDRFADDTREDGARKAAEFLGCIIVLKGAETVIAAPGGQCARNTNGTPDLATAGSGDVLSGIITGLLAQGMPPYKAACAGVWLHGEAGDAVGAGLIADDLPEALRRSLARLRAKPETKIGF